MLANVSIGSPTQLYLGISLDCVSFGIFTLTKESVKG